MVKKYDETKEFRYNYRGQSFSLRSRELQKFSVSQMISAKFFDAQMSKYTFKACFFLKYIRQTHVFLDIQEPLINHISHPHAIAISNILRFIIKRTYSAYSFYAISSIRKVVLNERPRDTEYAPKTVSLGA